MKYNLLYEFEMIVFFFTGDSTSIQSTNVERYETAQTLNDSFNASRLCALVATPTLPSFKGKCPLSNKN